MTYFLEASRQQRDAVTGYEISRVLRTPGAVTYLFPLDFKFSNNFKKNTPSGSKPNEPLNALNNTHYTTPVYLSTRFTFGQNLFSCESYILLNLSTDRQPISKYKEWIFRIHATNLI
jgi:hypothetical protein